MHLALSSRGLALLACGLILTSGTPAPAAQLDEETCAMHRNERLHLELDGVRDSMANGPEWAAANLPPTRLNDVKRLIELDELVMFRCPDAESVVATVDGSVVIPLPKRNPNATPAVQPPQRSPVRGR